jgi:hypothetical protein
MSDLRPSDWWIICGLGALWLGVQIVVVGRLPRALRPGAQPTAPKGTPEAFGLFWLDQYGYVGLTLALGGALAAFWGRLS